MPTFDGSNIFGVAVKCLPGNPERAEQSNDYPGLDGTETLDQGYRHQDYQISGILVGSDLASLGFAEAQIRSYRDGQLYTFVDEYGNARSNAKLVAFAPESKIMTAANVGAIRRYSATVRCYTPS